MSNEKDWEVKKSEKRGDRGGYCPRSKLLELKDILYENADEDHGITLKEIQSKLYAAYGAKPNRKTMYADMDVLEEYGRDKGLEILRPVGRETEYRLIRGDDELNYVEIKMLIDTVQASHFLTKKQADTIVSKLERLCSVHQRKSLNHEIIVANRAKSENYHILYTMDKIHTAIEENKQIRFRYYGFDMYKKKVYHHFGNEYRVSPFALIYHNGLYMLVAIPARDTRIRLYRIDRMESVTISHADRLHEEIFKEVDIDKLTAGIFGLHAKKLNNVTLRCRADVVEQIMDRFGPDVPITVVDGYHFEIVVPVVLNSDFYGWIVSFGGRVVIMAPRMAQNYLKRAFLVIGYGYTPDCFSYQRGRVVD